MVHLSQERQFKEHWPLTTTFLDATLMWVLVLLSVHCLVVTGHVRINGHTSCCLSELTDSGKVLKVLHPELSKGYKEGKPQNAEVRSIPEDSDAALPEAPFGRGVQGFRDSFGHAKGRRTQDPLHWRR